MQTTARPIHPMWAIEDCAQALGISSDAGQAISLLAKSVGTDSPAIFLAISLGRIAETNPDTTSLSDTLRRVQILFAAAVHSATRPPSLDRDRAVAPPHNWLLFALLDALRNGGLSGPQARRLGEACATLYNRLSDKPSRTRRIGTADCPLLSYGSGHLLPIACDPASHATSGIEQAGRSLGQLVRLTEEALDLWCAPCGDREITHPYLLTRIALGAPQAAHSLPLAWASAALPVPDHGPLRQALGHTALLPLFQEHVARWSADAMAAPIGNPSLEHISDVRRRCVEWLDRSLGAARLHALAPVTLSRRTVISELDRALQMAKSALLDDGALQEAWEIQRWGDWCTLPRIGRVFPVGLCLLALAAAGADVSEPIAALLESRREDGWRHYDDWTDIPPDADILGLVLQLVPYSARREALRDALQWPVELLIRNTHPDGFIPTWLVKDLKEPPSSHSPKWLGDRCLAVAVNAAIGLLLANPSIPSKLLSQTLDWIVGACKADPSLHSFFYPPPYVRLLLARLLRSLQVAGFNPPACRQLHTILLQAQADVLDAQQIDGSWETPLTTACHVAMLALCGSTVDLAPPVLFLAGQQQPDGLWPREPLYRCPGKDGAMQYHGSRSVTAAIVIHALVLARSHIGTPPTGSFCRP